MWIFDKVWDRKRGIEKYLRVKKAKSALHIVAETDIGGEGALKRGLLRVEVVELNGAKFAEFVDCGMGSSTLKVET